MTDAALEFVTCNDYSPYLHSFMSIMSISETVGVLEMLIIKHFVGLLIEKARSLLHNAVIFATYHNPGFPVITMDLSSTKTLFSMFLHIIKVLSLI